MNLSFPNKLVSFQLYTSKSADRKINFPKIKPKLEKVDLLKTSPYRAWPRLLFQIYAY